MGFSDPEMTAGHQEEVSVTSVPTPPLRQAIPNTAPTQRPPGPTPSPSSFSWAGCWHREATLEGQVAVTGLPIERAAWAVM